MDKVTGERDNKSNKEGMEISRLLKGGIYAVNFGYHTNSEGYTILMSDIPKLGETAVTKHRHIYT
jgi:hypothetical protein